jgi:hypothetical protein
MKVVPLQYVDAVWPNLAPWLEKACERSQGTWHPNQMWTDCRTGERTLIFFEDNNVFMFAAIVTFGALKNIWTCNVNLLCGASVDAWVHQIPQFSEWCRMHGAEQITFTGKRAQERLIPGSKLVSCLYKLEI